MSRCTILTHHTISHCLVHLCLPLTGLGTSLDEFAAQNPAHLIVITSAPRRMRFGKRQKEGGGKDNSTVDPKMGLFHRYQVCGAAARMGRYPAARPMERSPADVARTFLSSSGRTLSCSSCRLACSSASSSLRSF